RQTRTYGANAAGGDTYVFERDAEGLPGAGRDLAGTPPNPRGDLRGRRATPPRPHRVTHVGHRPPHQRERPRGMKDPGSSPRGEPGTHQGFQSPPIPTYFVSRNSSIPTLPPSRPIPECFTPPNGAAGLDTTPWLRPTMPASNASLTRKARLRSWVYK